MHLRAVHSTHYSYPFAARASHNEVRLKPTSDRHQRLISYALHITPTAKSFGYETIGGHVDYFGITYPHDGLEISAVSEVETLMANPFEGLDLLDRSWEFYDEDWVAQGFAEYLAPSPMAIGTPESDRIAERIRHECETTAALPQALMMWTNENLSYDPDATHVHSTVSEVLEGRAGVCQDYAHLLIAMARSLGVPTRYISGYLYGGAGIRGEGATHAWAECLLPFREGEEPRWMAVDPTNAILANDHHIRVHTGRDYGDVTPVKGVYLGPPASVLDVRVRVERVGEPVQQDPADDGRQLQTVAEHR